MGSGCGKIVGRGDGLWTGVGGRERDGGRGRGMGSGCGKIAGRGGRDSFWQMGGENADLRLRYSAQLCSRPFTAKQRREAYRRGGGVKGSD